MTNAKANSQPFLASHVFRPALVEARLMTAKHARDAVYVATLAEELSVIDTKLCAMEEALQVNSASNLQAARPRPCRMPEGGPDANWIREKSSELDLRLRRIEKNIPVGSAAERECASPNRKRAPARNAL
jgi:hypothetical protein